MAIQLQVGKGNPLWRNNNEIKKRKYCEIGYTSKCMPPNRGILKKCIDFWNTFWFKKTLDGGKLNSHSGSQTNHFTVEILEIWGRQLFLCT